MDVGKWANEFNQQTFLKLRDVSICYGPHAPALVLPYSVLPGLALNPLAHISINKRQDIAKAITTPPLDGARLWQYCTGQFSCSMCV